jgi:hypothetical protein
MGVNPHAVTFLVAAHAAGADFERAVTIGRQRLFVHPRALQRAFARAGRELSAADAMRLLAEADGFVEPTLEMLGARHVDSLDASGYEGSTIVHDMNQPIPHEREGAYSVVIDSGSLEHVFDFPTAIANCMRMARVGGHVLMLSPAHGEMGQGFYQFSPELLYRVFSPENGYRVEQMLLKDRRLRSPWYSVADPREAGERVVVSRGWPAYLYVKARREREVEPFASPPQQSDYAVLWQAAGASSWPAASAPPPSRAGELLPDAWKERYEDLRSGWRTRRRPTLDPRFFREVDLSRLGG